MSNKINPNYLYCSWCKREKRPGENWQYVSAVMPDTALNLTCRECKIKLLKQNGIEEDKKGNIVEAKAILVFRR